jgi:hypothetical protein
VGRTAGGDVYAGRDGNVYRQQGGGWQKYDNGNWGAADRPSPTTRSAGAGTGASTMGPPARAGGGTMDQLNRDSYARQQGGQRTRDYGSYQRSGSSRARRGGGGGRRR